jgi:hypothetical protein
MSAKGGRSNTPYLYRKAKGSINDDELMIGVSIVDRILNCYVSIRIIETVYGLHPSQGFARHLNLYIRMHARTHVRLGA